MPKPTPEQIDRVLAAMQSPIFALHPSHQLIALTEAAIRTIQRFKDPDHRAAEKARVIRRLEREV